MRTGCIAFDSMKKRCVPPDLLRYRPDAASLTLFHDRRKKFLWNNTNNEIEGFEDLFGALDEETAMQQALNPGYERAASTELLVYWFTGFGNGTPENPKVSIPLGHFAIAKNTAPVLHELWHAAVQHCHLHSLRPVSGVCDGAAENERFTKELCTHSSSGDPDFKDHYFDADTADPVRWHTCCWSVLRVFCRFNAANNSFSPLPADFYAPVPDAPTKEAAQPDLAIRN